MHYHAEFGRARSNRLRVSSREPENGSTRVMPPCDGGRGWPDIVAQYGRSSLNSVVKDREPQKIGSAAALDGGRMSPLWILLQLRMTVELEITGAIRRGKFQSNLQHQQTNTQLFTRWMPFLSPNQQRQSIEENKSNICTSIWLCLRMVLKCQLYLFQKQ